MLENRIEHLHRSARHPRVVLYLSRRDKRIVDNAALFYCYTLADHVIFGVKPEYIVGNHMQRKFIAEGLAELKQSCRQHNIPFVLIHRIDELVSTCNVECIVLDHSPLRYARAVDDQLHEYCKRRDIALVRVDAHNIVPYGVVKDDVKSSSAVKKRLLESFGRFVDERYEIGRRDSAWMSDEGMNDLEGIELRIKDNLENDEEDGSSEEEGGSSEEEGGSSEEESSREDGSSEEEVRSGEEGSSKEDEEDDEEKDEENDEEKDEEDDEEKDGNGNKCSGGKGNTESVEGRKSKRGRKPKEKANKTPKDAVTNTGTGGKRSKDVRPVKAGASKDNEKNSKKLEGTMCYGSKKMGDRLKVVKQRTNMYKAEIKRIIEKHDLHSQYASSLTGGYSNACHTLSNFMKNSLIIYDKYRNSADQNVLSGVSAYINDGQISAGDVVRAVIQWGEGGDRSAKRRKTGSSIRAITGSADSKDEKMVNVTTYLNEVFIWRETAEYFITRNANYDNFYGALKWAQDTLMAHLSDPREHYTLEQLVLARTSDPEWNAGQKQMVITGKMHGYVRMYWAKTMLHWFDRPEDAVSVGCLLNDTFSLDGNDGNGYLGVMWCMVGTMDQGFAEKSVLGKIRSMKGIKAKDYVRKWEGYRLGR